MDQERFDRLARAAGSGASRRSLLKTLAAAIGSLGLYRSVDAAAPKRAVGGACRVNEDCASNRCAAVNRGRKVCLCASPNDCRAATCTEAVCTEKGSCATVPIACPPANECFTAGTCQTKTGRCSEAVYNGDGAACLSGVCFNQRCCTPEDSAATCQSTSCGFATNNCGQTIVCGSCCEVDEPCVQDADCCSGVCDGFSCRPDPVDVGEACIYDQDCLSGTCCSRVCRDLTIDPDNCGVCAHACSGPNATMACAAGQCVIAACDDRYGDCDGDPGNGCETSLWYNDDHCGACGNVCPPATTIGCEGDGCLYR